MTATQLLTKREVKNPTEVPCLAPFRGTGSQVRMQLNATCVLAGSDRLRTVTLKLSTCPEYCIQMKYNTGPCFACFSTSTDCYVVSAHELSVRYT